MIEDTCRIERTLSGYKLISLQSSIRMRDSDSVKVNRRGATRGLSPKLARHDILDVRGTWPDALALATTRKRINVKSQVNNS